MKKIFLVLVLIMIFPLMSVRAEAAEDETLPEEYSYFLDSLPDDVLDNLPDEAFGESSDDLTEAAKDLLSPMRLLSLLLDGFGSELRSLMPLLATLLGIVILASVAYSFSSSLSASVGKTVELCARLCSFGAISVCAVSSLSRLQEYFSSLFAAVGSFLPLSALLYAMGGNFTSAVSGTATVSITLTVCQFICTSTVIPVFCICLSLSLLSVFDGPGGFAGGRISGEIKKWYTSAIAAVALILTCSIASQSIIAAKADNAAMRGAKFALSSFVPVSGGTLASTLGTLSAGVELLRGAVGVIGIGVILLMLIPIIIELALIRLIFTFVSFISGMLSCNGEMKLFDDVATLYGYLEGIAALSAAIFVIAFAIFAGSATPFS
jgi:stage III sporulation protein AE